MPEKLIFVYNADSGLFNTVTDIAHKIFSPSTYGCQLCAITHSAFSVRDEWKAFIESLDSELEFLHRDEWLRLYPQITDELPAVFRVNETLKVLISAQEISRCDSVDDLKKLIKNKLSD
ncbi:MAG: hypothetical protein OEY36_03165 [Gammaproteobacteria bacterium]|nr:hypothetical protein [Gammaproteobacteria bacterium]